MMTDNNKYLDALNKCFILMNEYPLNENVDIKEYSCIPCEVAQELISLSQEDKKLFLELSHKYSEEAKKAFESIYQYAREIQRNTFQRKSSCWGTVGDHCTYVVFMLLPVTNKFIYYGSFNTVEKVHEAMEGFWKHEIDLKFILEDYYKNQEKQKRISEQKEILPNWFSGQFAPEKTREDADAWYEWWKTIDYEEKLKYEEPWSISGWIYWFQPEMRQWFWWDAKIENPNLFRITVQVDGFPFPSGSLEWLALGSGAISFDEEELLSRRSHLVRSQLRGEG